MASQDIIITYKAEVDQLTQELKKVVEAQEQITDEQKQGQVAVQKGLTNQQAAAKKRLELLKLEEKELVKLKQLRALAFDPKVIRNYDAQIQKSIANIKALGGATKDTLKEVDSVGLTVGKSIASTLGAIFTVDAIIQFGKAAANAFLEAEENANRLKFAVTQIGGEGEAAFERLIAQSEKLQKTTIFSDDAVQQAQTMLSTFGLTATQIEKLIPKIAEFASATKTGITEATSTFIKALEGQSRGLVEAGLKFEDTGTIMGNYNKLLVDTEKFTGAAAEATQTLTGELEQQANAADELQEEIGSKLAPAWVAVKKATFEATLAVYDYIKAGGDLLKLVLNRQVEEAGTAFDEVTEKVNELTQANIKSGQSAEVASRNAVNAVRAEILARLDLAKAKTREVALDITSTERDAVRARLKEKAIRNELAAINDITEARKIEQAQADRILTAEQLRQKSMIELNTLLKANASLSDAVSKDNVTLINKELEARKKLQEEYLKNKDTRVAGSAEEVKSIRALESAYSELFALLSDQDRAQLLELSITSTADLEQDAKDKIALLEQEFTKRNLEIPVTIQDGEVFETFKQRYDRLVEELETNNIQVPAELVLVSDKFREAVAKLKVQIDADVTIPDKLTVPDDKQDVTMNTGIEEAAENDVLIWFERNEEILNLSQELFDSLVSLSQQYTDTQINEIETQKDAQIEALDLQQQILEENIKKNRVSEREAANQSILLTQQKAEAEKKAADKIAAIKRRQFNIDKAAALAQIAMDTAQAIAASLAQYPLPAGLGFLLLNSAMGAAQAALVVSKPNPYKKGSKKTKEGLALVGEEGPEIMFMPGGAKILPAKQTQTYGAALDAMYDKRFDKYIMQTYVTPALKKQKAEYESGKSKRFAENIRDSIVYNQMPSGRGDFYLERMSKGVRIANVDEVAEAIYQRQRSSYKR